jgi:O-antigen/teichoic acid export membrane protein
MTMNGTSAARSAKWSVVENGGLALISFLSLIVYAHFISVADFGLFSIVLALVELMAMLVSMLFHDALVQRGENRELHYDTAFTATLALSGALCALCWFVGPWLSRRMEAPEAGALLAWMSLALPLSAASATLVARRRRDLDFRVLALRSLIGRVAGAAAGIALVVLGFGYWGLLAQHLLMVLFGSLLLWLSCADRPRLRFGTREFAELIGFATASVSALMLRFGIRRAFIVACGTALGTHAAGLFNMSFRVVDGLWAPAWTAVSQVALPVLSAARADERRFGRVFDRASHFVCLTLYFGFVLLAATAAEVVELLLGPRWMEIAPLVTLLALKALIQARRLLFGPLLTSLGRPQNLLLSEVAELVFLAGAIALLGIPSVAWAIALWVAKDLVGGALEAWMVARATGIGMVRLLGSTAIPLAAAGGMFAAVWACRALLDGWGAAARLAVLVHVGAIVYFGCVALLERRRLLDVLRFTRSAFQRA